VFLHLCHRPSFTAIQNHRQLIGIVGRGVQLGSLSTAATNRPIVLAPYDYDDGEIGGMMIGRETEVLGENLPQFRFVYHNPHMICQDTNPGLRSGSQLLTA
jgi:hypothetical protein